MDLVSYDAPYIYVFGTKYLKLITEDEDLISKRKNSIVLDRFLKVKL